MSSDRDVEKGKKGKCRSKVRTGESDKGRTSGAQGGLKGHVTLVARENKIETGYDQERQIKRGGHGLELNGVFTGKEKSPSLAWKESGFGEKKTSKRRGGRDVVKELEGDFCQFCHEILPNLR